MIDNNLAIMMAERFKKISDVSKETGISRTTLTNIYYKKSKSISTETLEKLCLYLDCDIGEFLKLAK